MIDIIKFILRLVLGFIFRVDVSGLNNFTKLETPTIIIANHVSWLDGILLYAWLPKNPSFAIEAKHIPRKISKAIPFFVKLYSLENLNTTTIRALIKYIKGGKKIVIFPERRITTNGSLMKIYEEFGFIADRSKADIQPVVIDIAPYCYPISIYKISKITIKILPAEKINKNISLTKHERRNETNKQLQKIMYKLIYHSIDQDKTIYQSLLDTKKHFGNKKVLLEDASRQTLNHRQLITRSMLFGNLIKKQTCNNEYVGIMLPNVNALSVMFFAMQFVGRVPAILNFSSGALALNQSCVAANIKTIFTSRTFIQNAKLDSLIVEIEKNYNIVYLEDIKDQLTFLNKVITSIKSFFPNLFYLKQKLDTCPRSPAVVLFTSGSEGSPKGVALSHKNLLANHAQVRCHINFNSSDMVFCCLPLFHSFGLNVSFLMSLLNGCKVFLYPTPLHYKVIPDLIYETGATILYSTNTFLKGYACHAHPVDFNSLRYVISGAEKLHEDTMQTWADKYGHRIFQGYGVTEAGPVISVNNEMQNKSGSVGKIMSYMEYDIVPVEGVKTGGRLLIKGPNMMLGYLLNKQPGIVHKPYCEKGENWYDTGDIATIDDDGFIYIIGRQKRFAKIGGEMISLSAVEELSNKAWENTRNAAIALSHGKKGEQIILITENKNAARTQLQKIAKEHNMNKLLLPQKIITVDEIPLLGTGKVNYPNLQQTISPKV